MLVTVLQKQHFEIILTEPTNFVDEMNGQLEDRFITMQILTGFVLYRKI